MRILLLTHAFNSLSQRLFVELARLGHAVTVEFDVNDAVTIEAAELARPDLIIAPFLKRAIPAEVFRQHRCLVVHPGPPGDRGPSALDWAILGGAWEWGVTVLQATEEIDGGPVWASTTFPMRAAAKSSLYRNEVAEGAVRCVREAIDRIARGDDPEPAPPGLWRPVCRQADRAIDWARDDTLTVLRKIRSADGNPGLLDTVLGVEAYLYDAQRAEGVRAVPGLVVGRSGQAICRATVDGGVWIGQVRRREPGALKLPAVAALGREAERLPEIGGFDDIAYEEDGPVGLLHFPFHNGAMSTEQCRRLREAYRSALTRPTRVLVLAGGPDFWSNGIHLATIEAAASPADESWRNINAIDDLARDVITTTDRVVVAAMQGNAGAGGVFLALAADEVWARDGVILNPHYKGMGNLYGSEYWTYLLPRRAGPDKAREVTQARLPLGAPEAKAIGLVDAHFGGDAFDFMREARARARAIADDPAWPDRVAAKRARREADEAEKPLDDYRREELERMKLNFYGFDPSYHVARYNFITKVPKSRTPLFLAAHRRIRGGT